jgi:tripartite-type tricarboxylate transporter receptor subunit TctC
MRAMQRSAFALVVSLVGALVAWDAPSQADRWPQRTVRVMVPLPPGTSTDLAARLFAEGKNSSITGREGVPF